MLTYTLATAQGWGLLSQFSPFRYFQHFPLLLKQTLAIEYRVYIWQVSPQLSCGDTCQILMWFRESNRYFCKIEYFAYGEISERSFSNPHPWWRSNLWGLELSRRAWNLMKLQALLACIWWSLSSDTVAAVHLLWAFAPDWANGCVTSLANHYKNISCGEKYFLRRKIYFLRKNIFLAEKIYFLRKKYISCGEKYFLRKKIFLVEKNISCGKKYISCGEKYISCGEKYIACGEKYISCGEKYFLRKKIFLAEKYFLYHVTNKLP